MSGLEKRIVSLNLSEGIQTKEDPRDLESDALIQANNINMDVGGALVNRYGFNPVTRNILGGGTLPVGAGAGSGFLNELDHMGTGGLYSFDPATGGGNQAWVVKGSLPAAYATVESVSDSTNAQVNIDAATTGVTTMYAWEETQQDSSNVAGGNIYLGVKYMIVNEATGAVLIPPTFVNIGSPNTARAPRVLALSGTFYLFFQAATSIYMEAIAETIPQTNTTTQVIAGTTTTSILFDVIVVGSGFAMAYFITAGGNVTVSLVSTAGAVGTTVNFVAATAIQLYLGLINGGTQIALMYVTSTAVGRAVYSSTLGATVIANGTPVVGGVNLAIGSVQGISISDSGASTFEVFISYKEKAGSPDNGVGKAIWQAFYNNPAGTVASSAVLIRGCDVCSVAFKQNSVNYFVAMQYSPLQPVYFVLDESGRCISRLLYQTAGVLQGRFQAPGSFARMFNVSSFASGKLLFPLSSQSVNVAFQGQQVNTPGISRGLLDFTLATGINRAVLGGNLHISGSQLESYDGVNIVEHGFHMFPEGGFVQQAAFGIVNPTNPTTPPYTSTLTVPTAASILSSSLSQAQARGPGPGITNGPIIGNPPGTPIPTPGFIFGYGTSGPDAFQFADADVPAARGGFQPPAGIISIPVSRGDTPLQIANSIVRVLNLDALHYALGIAANQPWTAGGVSQDPITAVASVQIVGNISPPLLLPTLLNAFGVTVSVATGAGIEYLSCPPASLIKNSQFFYISSEHQTVAGTNDDFYVWFHIVGQPVVDPAPIPAPNQGGIQVNINATDTGAQVATAVAAALAAANGGADFPASVSVQNAVKVIMPNSAGVTYTVARNFNLIGNQGIGNYGYIFVYRWTDEQGQVHRSAPSAPVFTNVPVSQSQGGLTTLQIPTLKVTGKTNVYIEVYRTVSNGTVYYNATPGTFAIPNAIGADFVSYQDQASDAAIQGNETLYTTSGALPNFPAPPCSIAVHHRNRIFVLDTENPYRIVPSKQLRPGQGVAFSTPFQNVLMEPVGGPPTAMVSMDDKLVIFQAGQVWLLTGEGPDDSGNNPYNPPVLVSSRAGAVNQNGVVLTQMGVMYKSSKGIFLLDRSQSVHYIGSNVEGFNNLTITSAVVCDNKTRIVFTTSAGTALVFDYFYGQWSTWTLPSLSGGTVQAFTYNGLLYFLDAGGEIWTETPGSYTDNGAAVAYLVQTKWVGGGNQQPLPNEPAQQAWQRLWRAYFLGTFTPGDTINIGVQYDYNSSFTDNLGPYVSAAPGNQIRAQMRRQKGQAMSFLISGTTSNPFRLLDVSVELGVKKGLAKIPVAQTIG